MKISFCITCKNRMSQISKTLKRNLRDNSDHQNNIEFVLVDLASKDGLKDWVVQNFKEELDSGYLKFFFTEKMNHWDCSLAKNTAHLLATGDILVNLDCDNFTGKDGGNYVASHFLEHGEDLLLHQSSSQAGDGSFGRISMSKKYFYLVGGYNELFNPMGYQDTDLLLRLVNLGLTYLAKCDPRFNKAIPNTKDEGILYANSEKSYLSMCLENRIISDECINNGQLIVNKGNWGIRDQLFQYVLGKWEPVVNI